MSAMQTFYDQLQSELVSPDQERRNLAALTRLTRVEIEPLQTELGWEDWYATSVAGGLDVGVSPKH